MLARLEYKKQYSLAVAYFMIFSVTLSQCLGSSEIGGGHTQVMSTLRHMPFFQVEAHHYKKYDGLISKVCEARFTVNNPPTSPHTNCCWVHEGHRLCSGKRCDLENLVVSIPIILGNEVGDETVKLNHHTTHPERQQWDFPPTIFPNLKAVAKNAEIVYDLVGFVLVNVGGIHFTARYISYDHKKIYTYDGLKHKGYPVEEQAASLETHLAGHNIELPEGYSIWQAYYCLRGGIKAQKKFFEM
jgi:hypothetical protein